MKKPILVIDDDLFCRRALVSYLRKAGYVVDGAAEIDEAERMIASGSYRLMIADYHLPAEELGNMVLRLRAQDSDIALIIMTGDIAPETERNARRLSPAFFFLKPFNLSDVGAVVESVFRSLAETALGHPHGER